MCVCVCVRSRYYWCCGDLGLFIKSRYGDKKQVLTSQIITLEGEEVSCNRTLHH